MKTKEFIKKVKELGFGVYTDDRYLYIEYGYYNYGVATIDMTQRYWLSISYNYDIELDEDIKKELYELCFEYTVTPVDEREEEKKFYLKHRWMTTMGGFPKGLRINIGTGTADVEQMIPMIGYENQFTKKEIEEIKERFDTDLADFEEVEVEE